MKKRFWIPPLLLLIVILVLWLALPFLIKNYINDVLADIEGYRGSVASVDLNLIRGAYSIDSLIIDKVDGDDRFPFVHVDQINFSLEWGALFKGRFVSDVELLSPEVNFMAETFRTEAQYGNDVDWREPFQELMLIQINSFAIRDGTIHYRDMDADPVVDLPLYNLELEVFNISNVENLEEELPSRITMSANSIGGGHLNLQANANLLKTIPDIELVLEFEDVHLPELNDFFKAYAKVDAEEGTFSLYSEIIVKDGHIEGYVQPVILNLRVLDLTDDDHNVLTAAWEVIVEGITQIFRQHPRDQIATRAPISGEVGEPEFGVLITIWNVFKNAFIEAFEQSVEGMIEFENAERGNGE